MRRPGSSPCIVKQLHSEECTIRNNTIYNNRLPRIVARCGILFSSSCAIYGLCSAALFRCFLKASPRIVKHMHSEKVVFRIITFCNRLVSEVVARAARCEQTVFKVVARAAPCENSYSKVVARVQVLTRT